MPTPLVEKLTSKLGRAPTEAELEAERERKRRRRGREGYLLKT